MSSPVPKHNTANSSFVWEIGGTPSHLISAANTNPTSVKAAPGTLMGVVCFNPTATVGWLKLHDTAGAPIAGTTAVKQTYLVPASTAGNGFIVDIPIEFTAGIALTFTGGSADADTTAAPAGVAINVIYRD